MLSHLTVPQPNISPSVAAVFERTVEEAIAAWIPVRNAYFERVRRFALDRVDEGLRLRDFLLARLTRDEPGTAGRLPSGKLRILDLGAGNGGVAFGVASSPRLAVTALDIVPNSVLRRVRAGAPTGVAQVVGRGEGLPFPDRSFEAVLCLDSFEHFSHPQVIGREILRVLTPGGLCLLKTPARLKYLFRPDPHCGLPGLLLLPDGVQRFLVNRVLRWPVPYDVAHTYWHVGEVLACFPGHGEVELLWDRVFPGTGWLADRLWYKHRLFYWDGLVIGKARAPADATRRGTTEPEAILSGATPSTGAGDPWRSLPFPLAQIAAWDEGRAAPHASS